MPKHDKMKIQYLGRLATDNLGEIALYQAIQRHFVFGRPFAKRFEARFNFLGLDFARGIRQVCGLIDQCRETSARPAAGHLDLHIRMLAHVNLGPFLGENNQRV